MSNQSAKVDAHIFDHMPVKGLATELRYTELNETAPTKIDPWKKRISSSTGIQCPTTEQ